MVGGKSLEKKPSKNIELFNTPRSLTFAKALYTKVPTVAPSFLSRHRPAYHCPLTFPDELLPLPSTILSLLFLLCIVFILLHKNKKEILYGYCGCY